MSFFAETSQPLLFVWFGLLGIKCGLEQQIFEFLNLIFKKKLVIVLKTILNVVVIVLNCAQFYYIALKLNFGDIRLFMFLAFFFGFFIPSGMVKLVLHLKKSKKIKKQTSGQANFQ